MINGVIENRITPNEVMSLCEQIYAAGDRLQMAYAWYPDCHAPPEIIYIASVKNDPIFYAWRCQLNAEKEIISLANAFPLMGWYEREMQDLFGIQFLNHPEKSKLVLQDGVKSLFTPMDPHFPNNELITFLREPWQPHHIENPELQLLPFGPVRAGVCESAEFQYLYAGESILHFNERLFFKHRGMEKKFEGLTPELGAILAQRVSGVGSVAQGLAFSQAVETACTVAVPTQAKHWRVILSELERLYNHLHYLGHLCHTTTLKVGEAQGKILEEKLKQLNAKVTGSRFLREIITPGGLRRRPNAEPLHSELKYIKPAVLKYCTQLLETNTHLDRLIGTGILTPQIAFDEGATGPVARASAISADFRIKYPYASYDEIKFVSPVLQGGDALARMQIRISEIAESFSMIEKMLTRLNDDAIYCEYTPTPLSEGLAWTESPRGGLFYAVHFNSHGKLARVKIKSPSFSNWRVFPFTVNETNMMDYAINEASFGSTVAGCDR